MRNRIAEIVSSGARWRDKGEFALADAIIAALPEIAELSRFKRNLRSSFDAMCAMRNDINDVVSLPSLESDLLQGPETSIFCSEVAFAVIKKIKDQNARIVELESALPSMVAPLVWESGVVDWAWLKQGGRYVACSSFPEGHWSWWLDGDEETRDVLPSEKEAKAAANAHHVAQIMGAFATPEEIT